MGDILLNAITNSGNPSIVLDVQWELRQQDDLLASRSETITEYHQYIWARTKEFSLPIITVNSADTKTINDYWRTAIALDFTLNSSESSTVQVQITNTGLPLGSFQAPYEYRWAGTLLLRATNDSDFGANP